MKKILMTFALVASISTFAEVSGPKYRVEGSAAYDIKEAKNGATLSVNFMPEWKYQIIEKLDVTFGPKVSVAGGFVKDTSAIKGHGSINLAGAAELNYLVAKDVKVYVGTELGMGAVIKPGTTKVDVNLGPISKGTLGVKLFDKYNAGIFGGYGNKGLVGLEVGYTF